MLKFNENAVLLQNATLSDLNTSYVKVQPSTTYTVKSGDTYLNTSYVKVQLSDMPKGSRQV